MDRIPIASSQARIAELESAIANALAALDEGRYGDIRRILKTGTDKPLIPLTTVIARNGAR